MKRLRDAALWAVPLAFYVWMFWYGSRSWFHQDDFAWLGQGMHIATWRDFMEALFVPRAQGTIRPWSERLFFIAFYEWFGLDHRPYHVWVALTQVANLILLQSIMLRLTGSRLAAVAAPVIWLCNVGLATPLSWLSAYNQVLCAFFLLCSFRLLLAERWRWQWVVFLLGFGALEINVVYPALAAGYCLLFARQHLRRALWMFPASGVYTLIHFAVAAKPAEGPYAQHWGQSMVSTYLDYGATMLGGGLVRPGWNLPQESWRWVAAVLAAALVYLAVMAWRQGERLPAFGVLWFSAVIAPVLPLRDHIMDYYLAIPAIGLAMMLGWLLTRWRVAALVVIGVHILFSVPVSRMTTRWRFERGYTARALVEGMERANELHPGKLILLTGVNSDVFWSGFFDRPARLFGLTQVYLAPGSAEAIDRHEDLGDVSQYICSTVTAARALSDGKAVVYRFDGARLHNITRSFYRNLPPGSLKMRPEMVEVGQEAFERDLGEGWYAPDGGWRWMGKRAEVMLAAPSKAGQKLYVKGYCPERWLDQPIELTVWGAGWKLGSVSITRASASFEYTFDLPPELVGLPEMKVTLEVDRTNRPAEDPRELGLTFGQLGLR
ncbi:MAG: hypothetical protein HZB13_04160 [Acidobacteria bacterium]|nr:hypothetical protein [Acidobacteriota bacterium]